MSGMALFRLATAECMALQGQRWGLQVQHLLPWPSFEPPASSMAMELSQCIPVSHASGSGASTCRLAAACESMHGTEYSAVMRPIGLRSFPASAQNALLAVLSAERGGNGHLEI